jgi:tetratricopeptide (TPR) repeat protein
MAGGAALVFGVLGAPSISADMILTADGKWTPLGEGVPAIAADDEPSDEVLTQSAEAKADATYETVKTNKGFTKPAGLVRRIRSSDRVSNEAFRRALNDASSTFFQEAADGFLAASQDLQGFGKQDALWLRVEAYWSAGAADKVLAACDELFAAFPKTFYFAEAQIRRAKVAVAKGDLDAAQKALDAIKAAPGMNPRDLFRAEYYRVSLLLEAQKKQDAAAADYRKLVEQIDREKDAAQGATTRQQALVGLGNSLLAAKKLAEAKGFYEKATEARDADVLAGAYAGLGDVSVAEAKALREGGNLKEAKQKLEEAVLAYLRVTVKYRTEVEEDGPVLRALDNQARVFVALFDMSGGKDCELANNAYGAYWDLSKMLPDGPQKKAVVRDALAFKERRDAACKPPEKAPEPPVEGMK